MRRRHFLGGLALLAGIAPSAGFAARRISGTWKLASVGGKPLSGVSENRIPYFTIEGKRIFGYDGCNRFSGLLDVPGSIVSTKMACIPEITVLPLDWADVGAHLKAGKYEAGELHLPALGGNPESAYRRG